MTKKTHLINQELYDAIDELLNDWLVDINYLELHSFKDSETQVVFYFITTST